MLHNFNEIAMSQKLQNIWSFICRHKYIITSLFFVATIGFMGDGSVLQRVLNQWKLVKLQNEINNYQSQFNRDSRELNILNRNPKMLEKIAREKYFMKDSLEDIYVFEDDIKQQDNKN